MPDQKGCIAHGTLPGLAQLVAYINQKETVEEPVTEESNESDER